MSKQAISAGLLVAGLCTLVATSGNSAMLSPARDAMTPLLSGKAGSEQLIAVRVGGPHGVNRNVHVHHDVHVHHHVGRAVVVVRPVRPWVARPYFGTVVAGVTLGTVIVATTVAVVPVAPSPTLCWYWADPAKIQGYWDYCTPH
jgi:hypothetical protein